MYSSAKGNQIITPGFTRNNSTKNTMGREGTEYNSDRRQIRNSSDLYSPTEFHKVQPPKIHSINRIAKNKVNTDLSDQAAL
jgi:hypothetical protein